MSLKDFGLKFMGYWQLLAAIGAVLMFLVRFGSLPAQVSDLNNQHATQTELLKQSNEQLRQIKCGVLYSTAKDKLDCIARGQ